jgi:hypothetical protein
MQESNSVSYQNFFETQVGAGPYVSIDGVVKVCRTAPLLDLPVDFKEWFEPTRSCTPVSVKRIM